MTAAHAHERMKKELSLFGVFALATGTTLSAGFFLLPGLAAQNAGPALIICYLLAAVPMFPAVLSIIELSTAMPRAGGAYYFLDRSLGPLMGTVGGIGTWTALVLKTSFALVGMGAYIGLFMPEGFPTLPIAAGLAVLFGIVNLYGAKESGKLQIILVIVLLIILAGFIFNGSFHLNLTNFSGFFDAGTDRIVATAGMVYISYVGVTKVASVAEEVKNPERNLPLGILLSFGVSVLVYGLGTTVMVGVLGHEMLAHESNIETPVASTAFAIAGYWGMVLVSIAALFAFSSVANAGILSASRYPLAMSRDHLVSHHFRKLSRRGVPVLSVVLTTITVLIIIWLPLEHIVKLASATQLIVFCFLNGAVIVMRESRIESYDPGFRSPWYPWTQIAGIVLPLWFIGEMGLLPIVALTIVVGLSCAWYAYYGRSRVVRHGAIFHVFERLGRKRFTGLDQEMRTIMREKGLRPDDPFDELIEQAELIEADASDTFEAVANKAAIIFAGNIPVDSSLIRDGFLEGTRVGATPVAKGVALPHLRRREVDQPRLVLVRASAGIDIPIDESSGRQHQPGDSVRAIFFLISPEDDPGRHLRTLAHLAERVDEDGFLDEWLSARDAESIRKVLIRKDHYLSLTIEKGVEPGNSLIDKSIRELDFPKGCLIVLIHRNNEVIIPEGNTILQAQDRISIIGNPQGMAELKKNLSTTGQNEE